MTNQRLAIYLVAVCLGYAPAAHATAFLIFGGAGAVSYPAAAVLAGGLLATDNAFAEGALATGAVITTLADPPAATFYNGSFNQFYDPMILQVTSFGWLGSWGVDPTLPAPPADRSLWPVTGVP